ncbi:MAG: HPr kinase/phosphorylase [Reyranellales bacterium]
MTFVHATSVAIRVKSRWRAVLLRGPSGSGKSDLALRLIEAGGRLVADDQTHLARRGRSLVATPPPPLAGMIEARGVGIVRLQRNQVLAQARVALLVDLVPPDRIERLPEPQTETLIEITVPRLDLAPFEVSAVQKLCLALTRSVAASS